MGPGVKKKAVNIQPPRRQPPPLGRAWTSHFYADKSPWNKCCATWANSTGCVGAANSDDASVPCTPNPMIASRPCRSTSARICFTAFTRNAPPRATSWICGLPCTTYRFTKPRCIWPKPSTCSPTEKRHPYRHPLEKRTMARTQFTVPSSPSTDLTFNGTSCPSFPFLLNWLFIRKD